MNIIGCMPVYNEEMLLHKSLGSLQGACDRIIVIDGCYRDFPFINKQPFSTDQTMDIAQGMGAELIPCQIPWDTQAEKRSEFFKHGEPGDYYIFLDADEVLEGIPWIDESIRAYRVQCWNYKNRQVSQEVLRIFRHEKGIRFWGSHDGLYYGNDFVIHRRCPVVRSCHIRHYKHLRTKERQKLSSAYYVTQYHQERLFRETHQIP